MFVTTNYLPRVDESDHGTWRRLALVDFPTATARPHEAIETEDRPATPAWATAAGPRRKRQHEAVLAWLIEGAVRVVPERPEMPEPPPLSRPPRPWRRWATCCCGTPQTSSCPSPNHHIVGTEPLSAFRGMALGTATPPGRTRLFAARFGEHPRIETKGVLEGSGSRRNGGCRTATVWVNGKAQQAVPEGGIGPGLECDFAARPTVSAQTTQMGGDLP